MAGRLTTHVLDTASGRPAAALMIELRDEVGGLISSHHTNVDGRVDRPLMEGETFRLGRFELSFHVGAYFRARGVSLPEPAFLDVVPVRFGLFEATHFHVPLLVSPYGYSTYRGS